MNHISAFENRRTSSEALFANQPQQPIPQKIRGVRILPIRVSVRHLKIEGIRQPIHQGENETHVDQILNRVICQSGGMQSRHIFTIQISGVKGQLFEEA